MSCARRKLWSLWSRSETCPARGENFGHVRKHVLREAKTLVTLVTLGNMSSARRKLWSRSETCPARGENFGHARKHVLREAKTL
eukprot:973220-Prorocentrum_minimum.AAC.1